jgi:chaperonin GroES
LIGLLFAHFVSLQLKICHFIWFGTSYAIKRVIFFNSQNLINMKPINDRVVVKPASAEEKTKGGIIIPDTAKEKPQRGEVIAVGPGKEGNMMTVQVGDVVLYGKYAGQEFNFNGEELLIMREDDILVVLS